MPRELRIEAIIPLPDGVFEEAAVLMDVKPAYEALAEAVGKLGGHTTRDTVTPRGAKEVAPATMKVTMAPRAA